MVVVPAKPVFLAHLLKTVEDFMGFARAGTGGHSLEARCLAVNWQTRHPQRAPQVRANAPGGCEPWFARSSG
ncbi:hypothetical protein BN1263200155 [Stenotrophomonas maltophilia]|nr:hypothetical protein BN1263200155 [Stenotrophomonas maltophilia]